MAKSKFTLGIADHLHPNLPREAHHDRQALRARTRNSQVKSILILGSLYVRVCAFVTTWNVWYRHEVDGLLYVPVLHKSNLPA